MDWEEIQSPNRLMTMMEVESVTESFQQRKAHGRMATPLASPLRDTLLRTAASALAYVAIYLQ